MFDGGKGWWEGEGEMGVGGGAGGRGAEVGWFRVGWGELGDEGEES